MGYPGEGRIYDGWLTEVHVQDDAGVISHAARVKSKRSQSDGRLPAVFLRLVHDNVSSSYMICLMDPPPLGVGQWALQTNEYCLQRYTGNTQSRVAAIAHYLLMCRPADLQTWCQDTGNPALLHQEEVMLRRTRCSLDVLQLSAAAVCLTS